MARTLSAHKRAAYLDTALRLFVASGVQHTSTAEIARAAGTAAGTLFLYFPTKQHLLDALTLRIAKEQAAFVAAQLAPSLSVRDTFAAIWNGSVQWFLRNMDAFAFTQQIRDSGLITPAVVAESGMSFGYYYEAIHRGITEQCIKPYPIALVGGFLYHGVVAVMQYIRQEPDPGRQALAIEQGFDIFWDGIAAREGSA